VADLEETRLVPKTGVAGAAAQAAAAVADAGGSPRAQLDAARAATLQKLVYAPHQGKRQRERELRRLEKLQGKAGTNG
jgi:hypothetical protein